MLERRGDGRVCWYRYQREGGRSRRVYVACGEEALEAARCEEERRRALREEAEEALRAERRAEEDLAPRACLRRPAGAGGEGDADAPGLAGLAGFLSTVCHGLPPPRFPSLSQPALGLPELAASALHRAHEGCPRRCINS
jgi:hypothetical protein